MVLPAPFGPSRPNTSPRRDVERQPVDRARSRRSASRARRRRSPGRRQRRSWRSESTSRRAGARRLSVPPGDVGGELVEPARARVVGDRRRRRARRGPRRRAARSSASISSSAPVRTNSVLQRRRPRRASRSAAPSRPSSARSAASARARRERDERRRLALAQVVADRLAGDVGLAEHAEHVVAQLERLAERQPDRATARPRARRAGRRARRRGAAAARRCTCPTCTSRCGGRAAASVLAVAVPTRSSDWPTHSSMRSSSKTSAPRARRRA